MPLPVVRESGMGRGTTDRASTPRRFGDAQPKSLATVIGNFKAAVTRRARALHLTPVTSVWQRNDYEHVVRNEDDLNRIRQYIVDNPARCTGDVL